MNLRNARQQGRKNDNILLLLVGAIKLGAEEKHKGTGIREKKNV